MMRTALAIALLLTAAIAWAAEPSAADANERAAAAAAPERPFKPPAGYKPKRVDGKLVYCTKVQIYNSRFTQEECRTEAQLREMERSKATARSDMDRLSRSCSGVGCTRR